MKPVYSRDYVEGWTRGAVRAGRRIGIVLVWLIVAVFLLRPSLALASDGVVRALLFYSPSCPHCHEVMNEDLPPLLNAYDTQLEIMAVDTAHPDGQALYQAAIERFEIAPQRRGVPTLIIGDSVLVGSVEIPERLPGLIEGYLDQGGVSWPDIPGLAETLHLGESETEAHNAAPPVEPEPTVAPTGMFARFRQDVTGNSLSLLVLVGMIAAVVTTTVHRRKSSVRRRRRARANPWVQRAIVALVFLGLGVSVYMAYVETTQTAAVCGPVGDCNTVQQSAYARLFGLVPIGVVGVAGYAALGIAWAAGRFGRGWYRQWGHLLLAGMALLGTLFSIYLTFLEPFVIGATCMWCLTSAVTITLLLMLTADRGRAALAEISTGRLSHL